MYHISEYFGCVMFLINLHKITWILSNKETC